ncbi:hypothetical protein ACLRDC_09105 [Gluconacetobacter sacchari]|uniref:hypothetical protein n=1 Tax=Gluconacetobacter sacchari TaxID=92759 RepID=UPI0039B3B7F6
MQNELMVTALTCGLQDRYNSFTRKFNPSLLETERTLGAYFRATYGRGFQTEFDSYKTQLSLTQSEHGLKSGTALCGQRAAMFDEVAVLESAQDLAHYAQAKDIIQPASYETCAAPARTQHTETRTRARARATRATRSTRS